MKTSQTARTSVLWARFLMVIGVCAALSACDETGAFNFGGPSDVQTEVTEDGTTIQFIEEEVEKPDVFYALESGLWDGRPTFGGVWVSHPDTKQPEKVIIRNKSNGRFVVGALFRIERDLPGPSLRLSSDAAEAIGALAGSPVQLEVVALRTEKTPVAPPEPPAVEAPAEIEEQTLDPIAAAGAAIESAPETPTEAAATATIAAATVASETAAEPEPSQTSNLSNPYIQVASFSVEKNAQAVAEQMTSLGFDPVVRTEEAAGKPLWRVLVGPMTSRSDRRTALRKIRDEGYADAYSVKQ